MGLEFSTTILVKMIGGAIQPGKPVANLYLSIWSRNIISTVIHLAGDFKMGRYLKIPHRVDVSYAGVGANFGLRRRLQCDGLDRHGSWIRKVPTFGAGGRYGCYVVLGFTGIRDTLEVYLGAC